MRLGGFRCTTRTITSMAARAASPTLQSETLRTTLSGVRGAVMDRKLAAILAADVVAVAGVGIARVMAYKMESARREGAIQLRNARSLSGSGFLS